MTDSPSARIVAAALDYIHLREVKGEGNNPEILNFFRTAGHSWVEKDSYAWCSVFMCHVMKQAGLPHPGTTRARNWLEYWPWVGRSLWSANLCHQAATVFEPERYMELGDVVVLYRRGKNSRYGHVGIFIRQDEDYIWVLGGNQNDKVCIKRYPKGRLLLALRFTEGS